MSDQQTRIHNMCLRCKVPLWHAIAHCRSRSCPWCKTCATRPSS